MSGKLGWAAVWWFSGPARGVDATPASSVLSQIEMKQVKQNSCLKARVTLILQPDKDSNYKKTPGQSLQMDIDIKIFNKTVANTIWPIIKREIQ